MKNQQPQPFLLKNLKWFALAFVIPGLLFVYFIPRTVQYSDYSVVRWSPFFIIVLIALLIVIALILFTKRYKISLLLVMGSFVIIGPTFESFQDYREKKELDKYGVWTKSIVVDKKPGRKGFGWLIRCK